MLYKFVVLYFVRFSPSTRFSPFLRHNKSVSSYGFIPAECEHFVASTKTWCEYFSYRMFTSSLVNASAAFDLCPLPCLFVSRLLRASRHFSPCLVKLFVVDNVHGIFALFKTFLDRVFARVFLLCCSWMYFLIGLSKTINLFELSAIISGLWIICKKNGGENGVNLWKLYKQEQHERFAN